MDRGRRLGLPGPARLRGADSRGSALFNHFIGEERTRVLRHQVFEALPAVRRAVLVLRQINPRFITVPNGQGVGRRSQILIMSAESCRSVWVADETLSSAKVLLVTLLVPLLLPGGRRGSLLMSDSPAKVQSENARVGTFQLAPHDPCRNPGLASSGTRHASHMLMPCNL